MNYYTLFGSALGMLVGGVMGAAIGFIVGNELATCVLAGAGMILGSAVGTFAGKHWQRRSPRWEAASRVETIDSETSIR